MRSHAGSRMRYSVATEERLKLNATGRAVSHYKILSRTNYNQCMPATQQHSMKQGMETASKKTQNTGSNSSSKSSQELTRPKQTKKEQPVPQPRTQSNLTKQTR